MNRSDRDALRIAQILAKSGIDQASAEFDIIVETNNLKRWEVLALGDKVRNYRKGITSDSLREVAA